MCYIRIHALVHTTKKGNAWGKSLPLGKPLGKCIRAKKEGFFAVIIGFVLLPKKKGCDHTASPKDYLPFGGLLSRPPPDGLPGVLLGQPPFPRPRPLFLPMFFLLWFLLLG